MRIDVTERTWTGVYHLIKNGVVVYVGQTANIFRGFLNFSPGYRLKQ